MFQTIHMMRAVIRTELSPIVGSERQSEELRSEEHTSELQSPT